MLIDFSAKEEDSSSRVIIQCRSIRHPAGTYQLVQIPHPGDPNVFKDDLLVIQEELSEHRIIGMSVTSWRSLATQHCCPELVHFIDSFKIIRLNKPDEATTSEMEDDNTGQVAVAS